MNYNKALNYIHSTKKFGSKLGLNNIKKLLELLNNPQKNLQYIHVAGTNGKGSTSSFISNILIEAGYNVGLFTSPYIEKFTERIRKNNKYIEENRLAEITQEVKESVNVMIDEGYNHPTEFEIVTAIAFKYFYEEKVDIVVLEVGLGGRFDSTNIIDTPLASVITSISKDHINILGDTISEIAFEKAGIIKDEGLVVSYPQVDEAKKVLEEISLNKKAELEFLNYDDIKIKRVSEFGSTFDISYNNIKLKDLNIKLLGEHQIYNASLALITIMKLVQDNKISVSESMIRDGLRKTKWIGRLELIKDNPKILIDGAHNYKGALSLKNSLEKIFDYNRIILCIGLLEDKEIDNIISVLASKADMIIATEPNNPRRLESNKLMKSIKKYNKNVLAIKDVNEAVDRACHEYKEGDIIVISGSLYLIGDIRKYIKEK